MVKVKLYGIAKDIVGQEELSLKIERQIALEDLIKRITKDERTFLKKVKVILINGRNCIFMEGLKTQINAGDLVEMLPLVTGG